jgi:hypothetical protein
MTTAIRSCAGLGGALALLLVSGVGGDPSGVPAPASPRGADASQVPCAELPLQTTPFPGPLHGLRWLVAAPVSAGITGHLFYGRTAHGLAAALHIHGRMPDGGATKILWIIQAGPVGPLLVLRGHNRTGAGRTHQVFPAAGGRGMTGTPYPRAPSLPGGARP